MLLNHNYLTSVLTTLFLQFLQVPGRGHSVYYTFCCYLLMGYEVGVPDHLTSETCMQVRKQQLEPDMEQQTGSKLGKEFVKAVYCHPTYLTYMQSTSCKMLGWMKHKVESGLPGRNISNLRY